MFFFLLGEGEEGVRGARRGGELVFIENPRRGGVPGGGGARRVSAANWGTFFFLGGGVYFDFRGRNVHQVRFTGTIFTNTL